LEGSPSTENITRLPRCRMRMSVALITIRISQVENCD
jgi:hypothetical protein